MTIKKNEIYLLIYNAIHNIVLSILLMYRCGKRSEYPQLTLQQITVEKELPVSNDWTF